jgi:hypothetical protein
MIFSLPPLLLLEIGLLGLLVLIGCAWGPGHHLEFAARVLRRRKETLPAETADLLEAQSDAYYYGNLAADIINVKAFGGHQNHCHRWTIVEEMRDRADSPGEQAFVMGYLSHLAADTIAHNHFVPYHLARFARTRGLGHLYWEMNADRWIPEQRWGIVTRLKDSPDLASMDELINASVPRKAFSMGTNKLIFNHLLLVSERRSWRRGIERMHPIEKVSLSKGFLELFQRAAVERVRLALQRRGPEKLAHLDTTGKAAQKEAMRIRRTLLSRFPPGAEREKHAEELARPFLEGMGSPPQETRGATPHW